MSRELSSAARLGLRAQRVPWLARAAGRLHARLYGLTGGRGLGRWYGAPVLVLETVGRRSGEPRRTPIIYVEHGDDLLVMAANGGSDRAPAWWLNMSAAGRGTVTVRGRTWEVVPRVTEGEERERLWTVFAGVYPAVDEYTTFTERELPLVVLSAA